MAFTIKRHSLKDVHGMVNAAAQAKATLAADMQNREFAFREQSQMVQMQFAQTMKEQDFQNRLQVAGAQQESSKEAAIMSHQFDLQRIEMQDQNDFERSLMQQNMIKDRIMENKMAQAEEMEMKLKALDKAYDGGRGSISETSYNNAKLKLITGLNVPKEDPWAKVLDDFNQDMMGGLGSTQPSEQEQWQNFNPEQLGQAMSDPNMANEPGVTTMKHLAAQSPYDTVKSKWPWAKDKEVPNIPVMKANLTAAMSSNILDATDKGMLLQLLQTGSDSAIEQAFITLKAQVETGASSRPSYEGPQI